MKKADSPMYDLSRQHMTENLTQIDRNIDQMVAILKEELARLNTSFDAYIREISSAKRQVSPQLASKLAAAQQTFKDAKREAAFLHTLVEPLENIKSVNKLILFAFQYQDITPTYMATISNICLGQLKFIKGRYYSLLEMLRGQITAIWRDREVSEFLRLILIVNQMRYKRFLEIYHVVEVQYADIALTTQRSGINEFHQHVVLRLVLNRFHSKEEKKMIETLFPEWTAYNEQVA